MTLKLIALDIDGTLTNDEKKITEDTRSTLLNFQSQDHPLSGWLALSL